MSNHPPLKDPMSILSRREILSASGTGILVLLSGCKREPKSYVCTDTAGLTADEGMARTALGYVEPSPEAGKACVGCVQFTAAPMEPTGSCGTCKLMRGPIHPNATCKGFAPKPV